MFNCFVVIFISENNKTKKLIETISYVNYLSAMWKIFLKISFICKKYTPIGE